MANGTARAWYLTGVAMIAAALSDPLVESFANRGWLGGHGRDDDHASVVPALLAGIILVLALCARAAFVQHRAGRSCADRVSQTITGLATCARVTDIVPIVALQLLAVYAMESAEQLSLSGHLPDGLSWLGGPTLVSVAIHAAVGACVAWCAARAIRVLADGVRLIVDAAFAGIAPWAHACAARFCSRRPNLAATYRSRYRMPFAGGRAPPLLALP